jgi:hypothetical protein
MYLARRLQTMHPSQWDLLGSPVPLDLAEHPGTDVSKRLWTWVWNKEYRRIDDPAVTISSICNLVAMMAFFPAAFLYIAIIVTTGKLV